MNDLIKRVLEISASQEGKDVTQMTLKGAEEMGELAQAVLSYTNAPGSKHRKLDLEDVKEEIIDVFLIMVALAAKVGMNEEEFLQIAEKKIEKWINKMNKE
jgi:NTP pyrophosphatase (non-canonical NTP hydrolase)